MQIAVIGAGAVGCYYGAMLLRAGHDVTLVGRPAHVDAINARGLHFESASFTGFIPAKAVTEIAALASPDLVLFAVKSGDTDDTARSLKPMLKPDTIMLSLQNGVDNPERLRKILSQPVIAAAVYVATEMPGPGHIKHNGRGELIIGMAPQSTALAKLLSDAGVPTALSSTSQDLGRGKPSEIDFLNGFIVRKGIEHGIPTPTNHALQVMVKLVERSGSRRAQD